MKESSHIRLMYQNRVTITSYCRLDWPNRVSWGSKYFTLYTRFLSPGAQSYGRYDGTSVTIIYNYDNCLRPPSGSKTHQ